MESDADAEYAATIDIDLADIKEPILCCPNDPDDAKTLSELSGEKIDEVFIGSCMTNIGHFRAAGELLEAFGEQLPTRLWVAPPTKMDAAQLTDEGYYSIFGKVGARTEMPGCSLCMGNQARVGDKTTVVSTSTRNFPNRLGKARHGSRCRSRRRAMLCWGLLVLRGTTRPPCKAVSCPEGGVVPCLASGRPVERDMLMCFVLRRRVWWIFVISLQGANVYLASAELAAVASMLGKLPTAEEYLAHTTMLAEPKMFENTYRYLNFDKTEAYVAKASTIEVSDEMAAAAKALAA